MSQPLLLESIQNGDGVQTIRPVDLMDRDEFVAASSRLDVVLREIGRVPQTDDLSVRLRMVTSHLASCIQKPALDVLADDGADDDSKSLARAMVDGVTRISEEMLNVLVDLKNTQQIVTILSGQPE